jgi:GntR family transcriptional regulator, transcriptional repressor for pyruvate dehydrogenase complex
MAHITNLNELKAMDGFRKIESTKKYELVCNQLRKRILFGDIPPGDRLPAVQELSIEFGVSPATIREALRVLESEGLIFTRHGAGTFVVERELNNVPIGQYLEWLSQNEQKIAQVTIVREYIEGLTTRLCAVTATDADIQALSDNLKTQESLVDLLKEPPKNTHPDPIDLGEEIDRLAHQFHLTIAQSCGNEFAGEMAKQILAFIFESGAPYLYANRHPCHSVKEHHEILKYIREHNPAQAEKAMRTHIRKDSQPLNT